MKYKCTVHMHYITYRGCPQNNWHQSASQSFWQFLAILGNPIFTECIETDSDLVFNQWFIFFCCFPVEPCRSLLLRSHFASWKMLAPSHPVVTQHTQLTRAVSQAVHILNTDEIGPMMNLWCSTPTLINVIELHRVVFKIIANKMMSIFWGTPCI